MNGQSTQNVYGHNYDWSTVIDQDVYIRYSTGGVNLTPINNVINSLLATPVETKPDTPSRFELFDNYPNPFNPQTTIFFSVDKPQKISLKIYDARGRLVRVLKD